MPTRRELEARIGAMPEMFGPRVLTIDTGPERGTRVAHLRSGAGLDVTINVDRGLDAREAWFRGIPFSLSAPGGAPTDDDILAAWQGGLLLTCGFRNVGPPANGHALHGTAYRLPVRDLAVRSEWQDDQLVSTVSGTIREAELFGAHIECRRTWTLRYGENRLELHDEIRNASFEPERVFVLYHSNLGWPLIDPTSTISIAGTVRPRDDVSRPSVDRSDQIDEPTPGRIEEVLFHDVPQAEDGWAHATITSDVGVFDMAWRPSQLPLLSHWRSFRSGSYAIGIEPGNCYPLGATEETAAERGDVLAPGETKTVDVVYSFS